ncbi:MAG: hypothetical protein JSV92_00900 [archaeon]|nr:MAG: hypothetical protein JSV92_00900 [archaeon]
MMKKFMILVTILLLLVPLVLAQNYTGKETGKSLETGVGVVENLENGTEISGFGQPVGAGEQVRTAIASNVSQLREMIKSREQAMNRELQEVGEQVLEVHRNQNKVRLAVHSLLAMENLTGGIGKNVSEIAREFNNSVQATISAEERIEKRDGLTKFLFGGDQEAAEEIEQEIGKNRERIRKIRNLMEECECDEEVRAIMREQIENMEQEQERLGEKAQKEKESKGLFGWLWG